MTISKFEIRFLQNFFFLYNKNMTGHLGQDVDHSNWKISKIQISSSCGHFVEHWQREIKPNRFYCGCTVLVRFTPVATLLGISTVDSSAPNPDPSEEKRREDKVCAQGPLPDIFFPARCRPPWRRQSRHTALRGRASSLPARPRDRRDRSELQMLPGPPCRRASGRLRPRRSGL
jgi:hypothetical protein